MADLNGPLFDGSADRLAAQMCTDIEQEAGDAGVAMVRGVLGQVLKNPTGRYESVITAEPGGGDVQITDQGIVYGPWLEGTGSRNRTTRFKGYATFRKVTQLLQSRITTVADPIVDRYVRRMG